MGLLAKAAPQLNLLMLGFPLAIIMAFVMILLSLPMILSFFGNIIDLGFEEITGMFTRIHASAVGAVGGGQ